MSTSPKRLRWPIALFIIPLVAAVVGAGKITREMNSREKTVEAVTGQIASWHQQISIELPPGYAKAWNQSGRDVPLQLLRVCAMEESR